MLSDRLVIINKGEIIAKGTLEEVRSSADEKFRVVMEGDSHGLLELNNGCRTVKFGNKQIIYIKDENEALDMVRIALNQGLKAEVAVVTLEDVFVRLVGGTEEN